MVLAWFIHKRKSAKGASETKAHRCFKPFVKHQKRISQNNSSFSISLFQAPSRPSIAKGHYSRRACRYYRTPLLLPYSFVATVPLVHDRILLSIPYPFTTVHLHYYRTSFTLIFALAEVSRKAEPNWRASDWPCNRVYCLYVVLTSPKTLARNLSKDYVNTMKHKWTTPNQYSAFWMKLIL